jgi:formylglycine-generating enzyme required for sulfatase activity
VPLVSCPACGRQVSTEECSHHYYFAKPSDDLSSKQANFNGEYPDGRGVKGPCLGRPTKVGSYKPNRLGLYDTHGNVRQWCEGLYDPKGTERAFRGGCWINQGADMRPLNRGHDTPAVRDGNIGFRLVRVTVR